MVNNIVGSINEVSFSLIERILYNNLNGDKITSISISNGDITINKDDMSSLFFKSPF